MLVTLHPMKSTATELRSVSRIILRTHPIDPLTYQEANLELQPVAGVAALANSNSLVRST